jgi:5-enolpyruvylshikimate-3-phosphate synthase
MADIIAIRGNDRSGNALIILERIGNRIEITIDGEKVTPGQAIQAVRQKDSSILDAYVKGATEAAFATGVYVPPPPAPPGVVDPEWENVRRDDG